MTHSQRFLAVATASLLSFSASAGSISVGPTTLMADTSAKHVAVTLHNSGDASVRYPVKAVGWDQATGQNVFSPTTEIVGAPNRLVTYQAGDVFAGPSSSPVNLGGVRVAKDPRALDPLTPIYPVPMLGGVALDPATVEVLANRARVLQGQVGKGPFTDDGSALGAGAQQTQVVVRDPYGRETVVSDQRFYVAPTLLRKGLTTCEVAAGRVRQGESDYGTLGATGSVAHPPEGRCSKTRARSPDWSSRRIAGETCGWTTTASRWRSGRAAIGSGLI